MLATQRAARSRWRPSRASGYAAILAAKRRDCSLPGRVDRLSAASLSSRRPSCCKRFDNSAKLLPVSLPEFGTGVLYAILVAAAYTFAVALAAGRGRPRLLQAARLGAYGTVALVGLAVLVLAYAFVSHDFRIRYVAHYSDRAMTDAVPAHRALGRAGRLAPLVALPAQPLHRASCVLLARGASYLELQPYVIATLMGIVIFFCVLMVFAANPFATSVAGARDRRRGAELRSCRTST